MLTRMRSLWWRTKLETGRFLQLCQHSKRLIILYLFMIRLQEPKKDLIARVVRIIGNKKAIELLMETAEVEQNGGLFIVVRLLDYCFFLLFNVILTNLPVSLILYYNVSFLKNCWHQ